ncbi:MAG: hypothetical protein JRJ84_17675 [Deltaproteobacteria bacterium]|nr:hypothetical protein [Deltaproteobacteria bacterium]
MKRAIVRYAVLASCCLFLQTPSTSVAAPLSDVEYHVTVEERMGPTTVILRLDLHTASANPDDDGLYINLDFLQLPAAQVFSSRPLEKMQIIGEASDSDVTPKAFARQQIVVYEVEITRRGGATLGWFYYALTDRRTGETIDSGWVPR